MIIPIQIEKEDAKDCPLGCPFLNNLVDSKYDELYCSLFNQAVKSKMEGRVACYHCQEMFEKAAKKGGGK
jgi:hypothetical protein